MNKIQFRQKKYLLPLIILPFLVFIGYMISNMKRPEKKTNLVELDEFNPNLQDPMALKKNPNKLDALKNRLKKEADFSGIQNVEKDNVQDEMVANSSSLYTTDEMRLIDSLNQVNAIQMEAFQKAVNGYQSKDYTKTEEIDGDVTENASISSEEDAYKQAINRQMKFLDSIVAFGRSLENQDNKSIEKEATTYDIQEHFLQVYKADEINATYFNTINSRNSRLGISAILDENIKVVAGSRVRIRLLDDITVGGDVIKTGQNIYGIVSGFAAQRVKININSILVNNKPQKVNLSVYDLDGMEGFYIPESSFRDFSKEVGSKTANQNITIDQGQNNVQQYTFKLLQDIYKSGTQAVSKMIRQNKANLKYASQIYLINNEENKAQ